MPFPRALSTYRHSVLVTLAASVLIALACAVASVSRLSVLPPKFERRDFQTAGAVTHVLVDLDQSGITDRNAEWSYFNRVRTRADLLAHLMASDPVLEHIARRANLPPEQIAAVAPITIQTVGALTEPGSEARARDLLLASKPYRLEIQSSPDSPIVDVYAQAPSPAQAEGLANAAVAGARDYFSDVAASTTFDPARTGVDPDNPIRLLELGRARGAALTGGAGFKVAALTFLLAFVVAFTALRALMAVRRRRDLAEPVSHASQASGGAAPASSRATVTAVAPHEVAALRWSPPVHHPGGALALRPAWPALSRPRIATGDGNWPRTTRVLPWMLAAFMAMLWLVPFDSIQLDVPSPIDLLLDRLVLPLIIGTWALAVLIGGRAAPRVRWSWIHGAVGGFVVIAFLSVIFDAAALNRSLELDTALKKLPLLLSYLLVFLMISSVVRRDEVAAFVKFTLVLAVICALGMIWEDRISGNLFFDWSEKVLPGVFHVAIDDSRWDTMGRRLIHGPTAHPLVAAGMLSMAVPIAVLGVIHERVTRRRILYGIAGVVLMLGVLSTQRKTGLVAPVAGVLTLAYFRRRELLRLTPVAALLVIALVVVAPSTAAPVINQFKPDNLSGADTVSDRAADYDAIRPDVWTHFALGRGYGTYEPLGHRIIDSQILGIVLEMGVIGLVAFVLLGVSVVASARRTIHSRHPPWATSALAGAAAAVVFLVVATLFDSLAFPQLPYVFMCFAALVAVIVKPPDEAGSPARS